MPGKSQHKTRSLAKGSVCTFGFHPEITHELQNLFEISPGMENHECRYKIKWLPEPCGRLRKTEGKNCLGANYQVFYRHVRVLSRYQIKKKQEPFRKATTTRRESIFQAWACLPWIQECEARPKIRKALPLLRKIEAPSTGLQRNHQHASSYPCLHLHYMINHGRNNLLKPRK
jgi:hypothetical protein